MLTEEEEALWNAATVDDVPLDNEEVIDNEEPAAEEVVEESQAMEQPEEEVIEVEEGELDVDPKAEEVIDDKDSNVDSSNKEEQTEVPATAETPATENLEIQKLKPLKANGLEMEINDIEELYALASQGMNYTQKTQKLAPRLKDVSAMDQNGITSTDIALLIDAKNGDKEAIAKLLQTSGVDALDIEETDAEKYQAKEYGASEHQQDLMNVVSNISQDPEYTTTENIVDQQWDDSSRDMIREDPRLLQALHTHVKDGTYAKVAPEAAKIAAMDGYKKSQIEYYEMAGKSMFEREQAQETVKQQTVTQETKQRNTKRKDAALPKGKSTSSVTNNEPDFINMPDDEYMKHYNKVMSRA